MKEGEKKVIAGVSHIRLRCERCGGLTWISYSKRIEMVRCNDCLPDSVVDVIDNSDMRHGANCGRRVDRRKGEA